MPLPAVVSPDYLHTIPVLLEHLGRVICGTVVNDDDLDVWICLPQHAVDGKGQIARVIVRIDESRDERLARHHVFVTVVDNGGEIHSCPQPQGGDLYYIIPILDQHIVPSIVNH